MHTRFPAIIGLLLSAAVLLPSAPALAKKTTYKLHITNTTGRQLKVNYYCKSGGKYDKQGDKHFPGSKGTTKTFTTECSYPYVSMKANIAGKWTRTRINYDSNGGTLPSKNTISWSNTPDTTKGQVPVFHLLAGSSAGSKVCLYVREEGKVIAFPRKCP